MDDVKYKRVSFETEEQLLPPKSNKKSLLYVVLIIFVISMLVVLVALGILFTSEDSFPPMQYGIMIDAGSSGSRLHIYMWPVHFGQVPDVHEAPLFRKFKQPAWSLKVKGGIASFVDNVTGAGLSLLPLIDYAKQHIDNETALQTPIFLKATAGMRSLSPYNQYLILQSCRRVLNESGFLFSPDWATVISGTEEGFFAWVTINFLAQTLSTRKNQSTFGVLDLGGASTQISFDLTSSVEDRNYPVNISKKSYNLFIESYSGYGNDQARGKKNNILIEQYNQNGSITLIPDPCLPIGYNTTWLYYDSIYTLYGTSSYQECQTLAIKVLNLNESCSTCSINSTHIPALQGEFYGIASFFYLAQFFNISEQITPEDIDNVSALFCSYTWNEILIRFKNSPNFDYIDTYCFLGAYVSSLLQEAYHFKPDTALNVKDTLENVELSWALGAMLYLSLIHI
eukprot:TRINITY_DN440_c0_g1_i2.p1 TRINITY_DN440_c0_g1~~TRINITY_DN440_c0_g1_i2.p1  ORF type:complete len:472 (-),score=66.15 TRINITY_DN440_c0_g1_i2:27-1388(-)